MVRVRAIAAWVLIFAVLLPVALGESLAPQDEGTLESTPVLHWDLEAPSTLTHFTGVRTSPPDSARPVEFAWGTAARGTLLIEKKEAPLGLDVNAPTTDARESYSTERTEFSAPFAFQLDTRGAEVGFLSWSPDGDGPASLTLNPGRVDVTTAMLGISSLTPEGARDVQTNSPTPKDAEMPLLQIRTLGPSVDTTGKVAIFFRGLDLNVNQDLYRTGNYSESPHRLQENNDLLKVVHVYAVGWLLLESASLHQAPLVPQDEIVIQTLSLAATGTLGSDQLMGRLDTATQGTLLKEEAGPASLNGAFELQALEKSSEDSEYHRFHLAGLLVSSDGFGEHAILESVSRSLATSATMVAVAGIAGFAAVPFLRKLVWFPLRSLFAPEPQFEGIEADIIALVERYPGISKSTLAQMLGRGWGTIDYHLYKLHQAGEVRMDRVRRRSCIFPRIPIQGAPERGWTHLNNPVRYRIVRRLSADEMLSTQRLREEVALPLSSLYRHVQILERDGVLARGGPEGAWTVNESFRTRLTTTDWMTRWPGEAPVLGAAN